MAGPLDLISLIALVVALVAVLKLRSVLGHRSDEDERRLERIRARDAQANGGGDVVAIPRREDAAPAAEPDVSPDVRQASIRAFPNSVPAATEGLVRIAELDPAFDPAEFLGGAGRAYEMIVTAFADGDRKTLKELLSSDVYDGFAAAITEREKSGQLVDQQFVGIRKSDVVDADVLKGGTASVTVRFISELISALRDANGTVVEGDPQKIKEVTDIWTFVRDISSERARSNLNWRLDETQAPN